MSELLSAAEMRAVERAAIEAGATSGLDLMERAGQGVVDAILAWRPALAAAPRRAAVLCGPGNNGGDGFVIARLLRQRSWEVALFLYGRDPGAIDALPPDAAANARRWQELGAIRPLAAGAAPAEVDVCVDAIFGTGLARDLDPALCDIIAGLAPGAGNIVCVDMPTGLCSDSGRARPVAVPGALTVTFHRAKLGHYLADGPEHCGQLVVADIGLDSRSGAAPVAGAVRLNKPPAPGLLGKAAGAHKYGHGHALVLSGGPGRGGAARLAARAALRIGAGLVTVGCPPAALIENAAALDAVMLAPAKDAQALADLVRERKVTAVCIGPGFGPGARLRAFAAALLEGGRTAQPTGAGHHAPATVLDADALSEYADEPRALFGLLHPRCVLTPHEGEFARLFPDLIDRLRQPPGQGPAWSKADATREAAARAGCTVLFKGPDTVIADPSGRCVINPAAYERAAPWLATAGTGDVLAGFVTGLLARGFGAFEAAESAAWLHVECALKFGPGLISEDLGAQLPAVFRDLGV